MEHYPDLESLSLFLKVIEAGSFAKVSRSQKVPKASLSRRIKQLEDHFGSQLLIRNTRQIQLTEVGKEVHSKGHAILSLIEDTRHLVAKNKERPHGLLRVTAGVEYGLSVISPLVDEFLNKFPEVDIELDLTGRRVDLIYEGFDLGIRIGPLEDSTMAIRKIGSFRYSLFAGKKFVGLHGPINMEKLERLPTLGFSRLGAKGAWTLVHRMDVRTINIKPRLLSNNYWALLNAAKSNLGVVFMPAFLARKELERGNVVQVLPSWTSEEIPIHFVYPSQKYLTSKVRAFIDFSVERLEPMKKINRL